MKILRTCVVDDEPLAASLMAKYVNNTPFLSLIGTFSSAQEAVRPIIEDDVDLIFLDINMPQLNGLEFARIIPPTCCIIFTTAYEKYAVESFKVKAFDYLLKPINYNEFLSAATAALKHHEATSTPVVTSENPADRCIIVKSEYRLVQIHLTDILYLEGLKDYVKIYLADGSKVMTLMNMRTLEQALPDDTFMRIHRSYIVNTSHIKIIERNRVLFGSVAIPVSDTYKKQFADYVNSRLIGSATAD
ncbi:MAG: LytTR family DNA-binding domain-containing protein [Bacteroides sp.]|nr:LytTR family DNA-binding domain-containing protein [Bacteroides sp.]MCM1412998.1 LytTR family DNA-binding domain-containing protein [Bacteroides sp.]MCM1471704.1 LytTR family DNA-binding domain-containing protein [Bacteroides sp.]